MPGDFEPTYRALKREDGERILLFRDGGSYAAVFDDAAAIKSLLDDRQFPLWTGERTARFGAARLEEVLGLIVAAGRRAAVLERAAADH